MKKVQLQATLRENLHKATTKALRKEGNVPAILYGFGRDNIACHIPMIDARRMEVYRAVYDNKLDLIQEPEALIIDSSVFETYLAQEKHLILGGNGAPKTREVLAHSQIHFVPILASARQLVPFPLQAYQEERFVDVAYVEPFYLKPPNITVSKKKFL